MTFGNDKITIPSNIKWYSNAVNYLAIPIAMTTNYADGEYEWSISGSPSSANYGFRQIRIRYPTGILRTETTNHYTTNGEKDKRLRRKDNMGGYFKPDYAVEILGDIIASKKHTAPRRNLFIGKG